MELYIITQAVYVDEADDVVFIPFKVFANGPEEAPVALTVSTRQLARQAVELLEETFADESFAFESI